MGFCTDDEYRGFLRDVGTFEQLLIDSGIQLLKYYLDISKEEQARRLKARQRNPLKQWKSSPIDEVAIVHWDDYTRARDTMLRQTHLPHAPWTVVKADNKKQTRLNVIRHLVSSVDCPEKDQHAETPDPELVFAFAQQRLANMAQ